MSRRYQEFGATRRVTLLSASVTSAVTAQLGTAVSGLEGMKYVALEARFDRAGSGTKVIAHVQTTLDGASNWIDIAGFAFSGVSGRKAAAVGAYSAVSVFTPKDATLADDSIQDSIMGDQLRVKWGSTGDHGGKDLVIVAVVKG